jgi:hypothetical protein
MTDSAGFKLAMGGRAGSPPSSFETVAFNGTKLTSDMLGEAMALPERSCAT